jgi:hypothetical protein
LVSAHIGAAVLTADTAYAPSLLMTSKLDPYYKYTRLHISRAKAPTV